jgi:hypothetical protein
MIEIRGTTYFECPLGAVFDFLADPRERTEVQLGDRGLATIRLADVGVRD